MAPGCAGITGLEAAPGCVGAGVAKGGADVDIGQRPAVSHDRRHAEDRQREQDEPDAPGDARVHGDGHALGNVHVRPAAAGGMSAAGGHGGGVDVVGDAGSQRQRMKALCVSA